MSLDPFVVGVARLRRQLGATVHCVAEGPFDPTGEMAPTSPGESFVPEGDDVSFDGQLEAIPGGVVASGEVAARWRGTCRRCATNVGGALDLSVRERFVEGPREEDDAYAITGDLIDLGPMIRDAVVLELPLAPLCSEGCQGLCVTCGADLNAGSCDCEAPIDPRWARLDVLRQTD